MPALTPFDVYQTQGVVRHST